MTASLNDISKWFDRGKDLEATHMVVVCDTFDWDDYPVYVNGEWSAGSDPQEVVKEYRGKSMSQVMEVYDLSMNKDVQMKEKRAWHTDPAPDLKPIHWKAPSEWVTHIRNNEEIEIA